MCNGLSQSYTPVDWIHSIGVVVLQNVTDCAFRSHGPRRANFVIL